jgi:hypothetical protein
MRHDPPGQLGFDAFLFVADEANRQLQIAREGAHLPDTLDEALPFYRALIQRHHEAMLAGDHEAVMAMREEAYLLARKLNGYEPGILADEDSPGRVLDRETRAPCGSVPLWGQSGAFELECMGMRVRIEIDGMFGIGSSCKFGRVRPRRVSFRGARLIRIPPCFLFWFNECVPLTCSIGRTAVASIPRCVHLRSSECRRRRPSWLRCCSYCRSAPVWRHPRRH